MEMRRICTTRQIPAMTRRNKRPHLMMSIIFPTVSLRSFLQIKCSTHYRPPCHHSLKMNSTAASLPTSSMPIFTTVATFREWRRKASEERKTVGFVPTMGALHEGHIALVKRSLAENDLTVVSIFVNPTQFAPHEDLATYPRTLQRDLELLASQSSGPISEGAMDRKPSALFLPTVTEMYPSGSVQDPTSPKGTFVEVVGYSHQMEGKVRPTFFRGVATVVTKLFNAIEPTNAYFGEKDIQQALLIRRLARDLLLSHPDHGHIHIVPTVRDLSNGVALSSRNAYLSPDGKRVAPILREALQAAEQAWNDGQTKAQCIEAAVKRVDACKKNLTNEKLNVAIRLDYIELNGSDDFEVLGDQVTKTRAGPRAVLLSGALWVDTTRLIDNIILGDMNV